MNEKLSHLAERRRRLTVRAAAQRIEFAQDCERWRKPLALADRSLAVVRFVRNNSILMAGGGLLMTALRPAGAGKWLKRGIIAWQLFNKLRRR